MLFELPELPYKKDALMPHLSAETIEYHYGKHHKTYLNNLNNLIKGTSFESKTLEDIILTSKGDIFNNAAQVWNHNFYWKCLTPNGEGEPSNKIARAIVDAFGNFSNFKEKFTDTAVKSFGSGWIWLVKDKNDKLSIIATSNAGTPLVDNLKPLMTLDIWEHAYYIDYRNARINYIEHFWTLINWKFVSNNFAF